MLCIADVTFYIMSNSHGSDESQQSKMHVIRSLFVVFVFMALRVGAIVKVTYLSGMVTHTRNVISVFYPSRE